MQLISPFLNSGVREMLDGNDYLEVDMKFSIIEAYIDHATRFRNERNMTGVLRAYFNMMSNPVLQSYDQRWSVPNLETLRRDV